MSNASARNRVTVRVPATTANLGPAFDCMGMALDLWNVVEVCPSEATSVVVEGVGASQLPSGEDNLVYRAMAFLYQRVGLPVPAVSLRCLNHIPLQRGLGSSAAAIVGGLVAANLLAGQPCSQEELLALATEMEGHPDNVAPALLGGCQIVARDGPRLVTAPVPLPPDLGVVLFIPEKMVATKEARAILPDTVSREDAVYNMSRVALLVNALASGRLEDLRVATQDRLHQPARQALFPAMRTIFREALQAGALGVFLSGSGPTVLALTRGREMTVGYEMAEAARKTNVAGEIKVVRPSPVGAYRPELSH